MLNLINSNPDYQIAALLGVGAITLAIWLMIPEKKKTYSKGEIQHQLLKDVLK